MFNPNSAHALFNRFALAFGLNRNPQVAEGEEPPDVENSLGHATASPNIPSQQELLTLSQDFIEEENRKIDSGLKAQFIAIQKDMLGRKDFSAMPDAQELLIQMHGLNQADLDRGFERGGEIYAYRNVLGSLISFLPLLLTYVRTQPEHHKDLGFQLKTSAAYFASVLLTSCAGVACNARVLLHCTPFQDAAFDGSPYVARELRSANTPSYQKIKAELDEAVRLIERLKNALEALPDPGAPNYGLALDKVKRLLAEIDQNKGIEHYTGRAQLQRAYMEGLQRQSLLQTAKVYGNLAAGWASFLKNDPRLGMYIQLAVGMAQIIGQRLLAPADQRQLQNNLFEVEISSRPLSGEDHHADDQIIRGMLRTPREVRALNIQMLVTSYVDTQAQLIADALGMDATDYKKYRRLLRKEDDYKRFELLRAEIDEKRSALDGEVRCGMFNGFVDASSEPAEREEFAELITEVHTATRLALGDIENLIALERKVARNSLSEEERARLDGIKHSLGSLISLMPAAEKESFFGKRALLFASTCAARRRSPQNLAFDSDVLSATFNTLSTRLSDEEILAEIIVKLAGDNNVIPETMHVCDGRIVARVDPRDSDGGDTYVGTPGAPSASIRFDNMENIFVEKLGISQAELQELIDFINGKTDNQLHASRSTSRAELQRTQDKLDKALANLDSENILNIWGVVGLEAELIRATRSKNYLRERDIYPALAKKFNMSEERYEDFHELRMHCESNVLRGLSLGETNSLNLLKEKNDILHHKVASKKSSATSLTDLKSLEEQYSEIENDPRYIIERRFEKVSDCHQKLVFDGMQVTRNEGFFNIKKEAGMLLKEGLRRSGNAPEYMAAYAAGMWRAFQLGVTGVNGPLILTAAVGLCEQIYKSTLEDPHAFKSPAWPKAITTAITFVALAANIHAASCVAEAKVSPLPWKLNWQKFCGGTGSIAETIMQVGKLVVREMFREAERAPGDPMYGEIGIRRIASRYYFATMQAGARIGDGLAILINGGRQAQAARKSFEARMANNDDLEGYRGALDDLKKGLRQQFCKTRSN